MEDIILFEPRAVEVAPPIKLRHIPFKIVQDAPISDLRKPKSGNRNPDGRGRPKLLTPEEALTKAKRLLQVMSIQDACYEMGFGKNYLYSIKSKYPELWFEIIGE